MNEKPFLTSIVEFAIFLVLGGFIYKSNGWALAISVTLIGVYVLALHSMCRNIINRLSILYDKTGN